MPRFTLVAKVKVIVKAEKAIAALSHLSCFSLQKYIFSFILQNECMIIFFFLVKKVSLNR